MSNGYDPNKHPKGTDGKWIKTSGGGAPSELPEDEPLSLNDPNYELPHVETFSEHHSARKEGILREIPYDELTEYQKASCSVSGMLYTRQRRWEDALYGENEETIVAMTLARSERLKKINDDERQTLRDLASSTEPMTDKEFAAIAATDELAGLADRSDLTPDRVKELTSSFKQQKDIIERLEANETLDSDCRKLVEDAKRWNLSLTSDQTVINRYYSQLPEAYSTTRDCELAVNPHVHPKMLVALYERRGKAWASRSKIAAAVASNPQVKNNLQLADRLQTEANNPRYNMQQRSRILDALDKNLFS